MLPSRRRRLTPPAFTIAPHPALKSRAYLKSRLLSLRERKKQNMLNQSSEKIPLTEACPSRGVPLGVATLEPETRRRLIEQMRLMTTASGRYLNVNMDDISTAMAYNAFEKNCVFLWAAYLGRLDLLRRFRDEGADLNFAHADENFNALHLAALSGSVECTQWLLREGCEITFTLEGLSPLHFAAASGSLRILLNLVEYGCRIDATVLHAAVYADAEECVRYLLATPIVVNGYDETGKTPLHVAADLGNVRLLNLLLADERVDVNAKTVPHQYTPLHLVAENGFATGVFTLLKSGADVDALSERRRTPLYLACKDAYLDCVELLLDQGAAVNVQDTEKRTPLHAAISKNPWSLKIVQLLVDHDADVHLADMYGYTALHVAALNELEKCVEYLIMSGANVAARTKGNISALNIINRKTPLSANVIPKRLDLSVSYKEQNLKLTFRDIIRNSEVGEIGYLYTLQKEGHEEVLEHPLCQAFLHLKWQTVRGYILLRVILSIFLAILLSGFVLMGITEGCNDAEEKATYFVQCRNSTLGAELVKYQRTMSFCWDVIMGFIVLNLIRIFFSLAAYRSVRHYFSKYLNLQELIVTVGFIVLSSKTLRHFLSYNLHLPVGATTVLCCWMYLMMTIGQLPFFGTYIAMFNKVLKEFAKMIMAFFCLLVGFTFTFCVLNSKYFENPVIGFVKIIGMMTGELNLESLTEKPDSPQDYVPLGYATLVLVLWLFMILVTIVLMNLLVGIAVYDVEGLRKRADLCKLIQQTKLIYFIELTCFRGFFPKSIMNLLRRFLYMSPDSYKVVMYVRPLSPHEKRLPKDVMEAAIKVAVARTSARSKMNNKTPTVEQRISSLEDEVVKLQNLIVNLTEKLDMVDEKTADVDDDAAEGFLATITEETDDTQK